MLLLQLHCSEMNKKCILCQAERDKQAALLRRVGKNTNPLSEQNKKSQFSSDVQSDEKHKSLARSGVNSNRPNIEGSTEAQDSRITKFSRENPGWNRNYCQKWRHWLHLPTRSVLLHQYYFNSHWVYQFTYKVLFDYIWLIYLTWKTVHLSPNEGHRSCFLWTLTTFLLSPHPFKGHRETV